MAGLLSAEISLQTAKEEAAAAAAEKAALEEELAAVQRRRQRLPFQIEEIGRAISEDENSGRKLALRVAVMMAIVAAFVRWQAGEPESMTDCLLLPTACAAAHI